MTPFAGNCNGAVAVAGKPRPEPHGKRPGARAVEGWLGNVGGRAGPDAGTDTGAGTPEMHNGGQERGRVRKVRRLPDAGDCGPIPPAGGCPQTAGSGCSARCPAPNAPSTHPSSHFQCHFIDTDPPFPSRRCDRWRFGNVFRPRPQPNAPWDRSRASRSDRHARTTRPAATRADHPQTPFGVPDIAAHSLNQLLPTA